MAGKNGKTHITPSLLYGLEPRCTTCREVVDDPEAIVNFGELVCRFGSGSPAPCSGAAGCAALLPRKSRGVSCLPLGGGRAAHPPNLAPPAA